MNISKKFYEYLQTQMYPVDQAAPLYKWASYFVKKSAALYMDVYSTQLAPDIFFRWLKPPCINRLIPKAAMRLIFGFFGGNLSLACKIASPLNKKSEVITGKSQTEAWRIDKVIARSIHQGLGLRTDEVNKLFIMWPF